MWGYSSAGRAVALQAKGRRFDPVYLHQNMRGSYSGNTLAFQANAESSILLPRSRIIMKLFEATIRVDGKEFKDRVGADSAEEARKLLQQRWGPRAVPYIPHMIPS